MNTYMISTNTGLCFTNDEKLASNKLTIDDFISGKFADQFTIYFITKNGETLWESWSNEK